GPRAASDKLLAGEIDVAFMMMSWESPVVRQLIADERVGLSGFPRADAFVALYPYINKVVVPRGVGNLTKDQPPNDVTLIATNIPSSHAEPIPLADACELYPRARLTVSTLRAEAERGRLDIFKLGRRLYTTPAAMRAMVTKCQDDARPRASTSIRDAGPGLS